jgi:hypothetical protein
MPMPMQLLAFIPGDVTMPIEELRQAVPGLAGIVGLLLFPTIGAWLRLLLEFLEWTRPGLTRPKPVSGVSIVRAITTSIGLTFFVATWFRAAGQLRDVQAEAPVVGPSIQGVIVGILFWAIYAVAISTLRRDVVRSRNARRVGTPLR